MGLALVLLVVVAVVIWVLWGQDIWRALLGGP